MAKCKEHNGPFVDMTEMEDLFAKGYKDDQIKRILRYVLLYRRHTSLKDFHENSALYKVNSMSVADDVTDDELRFPSEEDMMKYLSEEASDESAEPINAEESEGGCNR